MKGAGGPDSSWPEGGAVTSFLKGRCSGQAAADGQHRPGSEGLTGVARGSAQGGKSQPLGFGHWDALVMWVS